VAAADVVDWTSVQAQRWQQLADELRRRLGSGVTLDPASNAITGWLYETPEESLPAEH